MAKPDSRRETTEPVIGRRARKVRCAPTIADVARLAGVAPMTVSRVVNGEANVLAVTRDRVRDAIVATGYRPNLAARSLAGGRQCRIALLYANPSSSYLSEILVGCLAEASLADAQLVVEHCVPGDVPQAVSALLKNHQIDAVVLPPPLSDDAMLLAEIERLDIPVAQVGTSRPVTFAHAVMIDDHGAARMMTDRLLSLGHRRIGFICGKGDQSASDARLAGYAEAIVQSGGQYDASLVASGDFTFRSGRDAALAMLTPPDRPTAIFASNDDMAVGVVAAAHQLGLVVPDDVSVCGFDDTAAATFVWPELTTIRQPVADMARHACRLLIEATGPAAKAGAAVCQVSLGFELVVRGSDGHPKTAQNQ